jgi:hypothetical protein
VEPPFAFALGLAAAALLLDDPLEEELPVDEFIFMPGMLLSMPGMLPIAEFDEPEELEPLVGAALWWAVGAGVTATVLPPLLDLLLDEEELDDEEVEPLADVDFAGGRVTATVPPALPVGLLLAVGDWVAAGTGAAGAPEEAAAGAPAVFDVSFWDHSPMRDSTPARTAIAMIAPTTQDVLLGCSSPLSPWSSGSLFGFAIFAPVAMVYAEIVGPKR